MFFPTSDQSLAVAVQKRTTTHLYFLDGIRGLSAFYVLLHHAYLSLLDSGIGEHGGWSDLMIVLRPLAFGRYAVVMFIVLSGYSLMLSAMRSGISLKGGFTSYIKRRAIRILPPYYAALVLSLFIIAVVRYWSPSTDSYIEYMPELPGTENLLAHVFLVHNLVKSWAYAINAPLWSVATEWQIYFFFPFILLPLWKKLGAAATVVVAFLIGYTIYALLPETVAAAPWYLGLFGLGMAAAGFQRSSEQLGATPKDRFHWGILSLASYVILSVVGMLNRGWFGSHAFIVEPLFGIADVCFILHCRKMMFLDYHGIRSLAFRITCGRWAVWLGAFSYSLYLIHIMFVCITVSSFRHFAFSPNLQIMVTFGITVPVAIGAAYIFHFAFERPFLPGHPRTTQEVEQAAAISPAI